METPLMVGFGIKTKTDVEQIQAVVDGAIIGSAYLKSIESESSEKFLEEIN